MSTNYVSISITVRTLNIEGLYGSGCAENKMQLEEGELYKCQ
jgi:hypothetical protein